MTNPNAGPLTHAETIERRKAGLGCLCRHELLDPIHGEHCDGPLFSDAGGYCWSCMAIRRCATHHL